MARKKIVPEEEVSKPAMAEETTAANADDAKTLIDNISVRDRMMLKSFFMVFLLFI